KPPLDITLPSAVTSRARRRSGRVRRILCIFIVLVLITAVVFVGTFLGLSIYGHLSSPSLGYDQETLTLTDCSRNTAMCVSSMEPTDSWYYIPPLVLPVSVSDSTGWDRAVRAVKDLSRASVESEVPDTYLRVSVEDAFFYLVSDVELLANPATHVIHVRSAARAGYTDFEMNRDRVESLRLQLAEDGIVEAY
ncbi:protein of unknown function DUF1499, partial [Kipferlia bialata]